MGSSEEVKRYGGWLSDEGTESIGRRDPANVNPRDCDITGEAGRIELHVAISRPLVWLISHVEIADRADISASGSQERSAGIQ